MITSFTGFIVGIFKNLIFIAYSVVEAFVFMIAFNAFAPFFNTNLYELPVVEIGYWESLSLFVVIHFIGGFIKKLSPFSISVNSVTCAGLGKIHFI